MKRAWITVAIVAGLFLLTDWILHRDTGLTRTATTRAGQDVLDAVRVDAIDLQDLERVSGYPAGITLRWAGAWHVPSTGLYDLALESLGPSRWQIDGQLANEVPASDQHDFTRTVWLTAGFHQLEISYDPDPGAPRLVVAAAKTGLAPEPLATLALKPRAPRNPRLHAAGGALEWALGALLIVTLVIAIRWTMPAVLDRVRRVSGRALPRLPAFGKAIAWATLAVILSYGALLRIDAITAAYGPVASPAWLAALQTRQVLPPATIRPASLIWRPAPLYPHAEGPATHYASDPYVYLKAGREMRSFYAAHFREPVFPFATKISLALLGGQDVAVSFASTAFAVFAIWLTYVLGAAVWSRPVGLAAALGLALDADAIALASAGWRDDAFVATVALAAYLMLRCRRAGSEPVRMIRLGRLSFDRAFVEALVLGVVAGLACLVRIMAVSFVATGAAWLLLTMRSSWRRRLTMTGIGAVTALLVAAPYFVNCWRVYGDPLYTFNVHGNIYRVAEGKGESNQGTVAYVAGKLASSPVEMTDTIARGLTTYPFGNKWQGLDRWIAGIRDWARIAAVLGLILLAVSAAGRVMLFVMVMSLVPFSFTWTVDPNWRFTAHVYPFLLIASAVGVSGALQGLWRVLAPARKRAAGPPPAHRTKPTPWLVWAAAGAVVGLGVWAISSGLPRRLFVENLRLHGVATVTAGTRDRAFLGPGWSDVAGSGNVRMRVATAEAVLSIPLPDAADYDVTLRVDPFPRPLGDSIDELPMLDFTLNGASISTIALRWSPERVGSYDLRLPRALTRRGDNQLGLRLQQRDRAVPVHAGLSEGAAFGLWYLRVQLR